MSDASGAARRRGGGGGTDIEWLTIGHRVTGFPYADRFGPTLGIVALKKVVKRLTTSDEELDRTALSEYCDELGVMPITDLAPRTRARIGGEVRSVRVVPRAGAPALEVTISDGRGNATAVFLGRRKIAGVVPGRKIIIEGVAGQHARRYLMFNPLYTLLS